MVFETPKDMTTTEIPIIQYGVSTCQKYRLAQTTARMVRPMAATLLVPILATSLWLLAAPIIIPGAKGMMRMPACRGGIAMNKLKILRQDEDHAEEREKCHADRPDAG